MPVPIEYFNDIAQRMKESREAARANRDMPESKYVTVDWNFQGSYEQLDQLIRVKKQDLGFLENLRDEVNDHARLYNESRKQCLNVFPDLKKESRLSGEDIYDLVQPEEYCYYDTVNNIIATKVSNSLFFIIRDLKAEIENLESEIWRGGTYVCGVLSQKPESLNFDNKYRLGMPRKGNELDKSVYSGTDVNYDLLLSYKPSREDGREMQINNPFSYYLYPENGVGLIIDQSGNIYESQALQPINVSLPIQQSDTIPRADVGISDTKDTVDYQYTSSDVKPEQSVSPSIVQTDKGMKRTVLLGAGALGLLLLLIKRK